MLRGRWFEEYRIQSRVDLLERLSLKHFPLLKALHSYTFVFRKDFEFPFKVIAEERRRCEETWRNQTRGTTIALAVEVDISSFHVIFIIEYMEKAIGNIRSMGHTAVKSANAGGGTVVLL
jgi:hypothetical protein